MKGALVVLLLLMVSADAGSCVAVSNNSVCAPYIGDKCAWLADEQTTDEREGYLATEKQKFYAARSLFDDDASFEYVLKVTFFNSRY